MKILNLPFCWLWTVILMWAWAGAGWAATEKVLYNFGSFCGDASTPLGWPPSVESRQAHFRREGASQPVPTGHVGHVGWFAFLALLSYHKLAS